MLAFIAIFFLHKLGDQSHLKNLYFPFFKNLILNMGIFFIPFYIFVIIASSNAVNLTDGLDGLATVPVILVAASFAFICYVTGNAVFSNYLQIPYIEELGEVSIFCGSICGACLGFLWFNAPPAKIFMGDTGSLSLGGSLGAIGIVSKHEIILAIIGGLFVLETVSVIIQVASFKLTGKRIFQMAPLHHHFEKKGWAESTDCNQILDYFNNFSFVWIGNTKIEIMGNLRLKFTKKKILIYGLAKSGLSTLRFLKKINSEIYCWDDNFLVRKSIKKNYLLNFKKKIANNFFDFIVSQPRYKC